MVVKGNTASKIALNARPCVYTIRVELEDLHYFMFVSMKNSLYLIVKLIVVYYIVSGSIKTDHYMIRLYWPNKVKVRYKIS